MPSNPPKVRPLSDFGGPSRSAAANPSRVADAAGKAAKVLGPEGAAAGAVAGAAKGHHDKALARRHAKFEERNLSDTGRAQAGLPPRGAQATGSRAGRSVTLPKLGSTSQSALVAEFIACVLILLLSPLGKDVSAKDFMKRGTAVSLLFIVLAMIGSAGPSARRTVTAFGALLTLVVFLDQRNLLLSISGKFSSGNSNPGVPPVPPGAIPGGAAAAAKDSGNILTESPAVG